MTISLSTVSGTLSATAIDTNFNNLQKHLIEGIAKGDIDSNDLDKYVLKRYTDGRISSATVGSYPIYDYGFQQNLALVDIVPDFVKPRLDTWAATGTYVGDLITSAYQYPFELLGSPGPSFLVDGQEDGVDLTSKQIVPAVPLWISATGTQAIPQYMYKRFPQNECWSRWLTVPQCSTKIYIPEPCVALVNAQFTAIPGPGGSQYKTGTGAGAYWDPYETGKLQYATSFRTALVVDTNPILRDGIEFANTNANIRDPADGSQASHVSWKIFQDKTCKKASLMQNNIRGAVALQGGTWYNFSCKYKGAGTFGTLANHAYSNGNSGYVIEGYADQLITAWNIFGGATPPTGLSDSTPARYSIGDIFWANTNMQIDLFYGRSVAEVNNISNNDLHSTPSHGY